MTAAPMPLNAPEPSADGSVACPVCATSSPTVSRQEGWGSWHRCPRCTLEFVEPRTLERPPTTLFDAAYRGEQHGGGFEDFAHRVRQRDALKVDPSLWFWTPAFQETIDWLRPRVGPGGTVLEIGCGLGFLLHALRREGFTPVGLDVAEIAVDLNRRDGFKVWHGALDTLPEGWVEPKAIVAFFMLHHVEEPLALLRLMHERWPGVPVALAQYGPANLNQYSSLAPRNLTRWSAAAVRQAFEEVGYDVEVRSYPSSGAEHSVLHLPRSAAFELLIRVPPLYRATKRILDRVLPLMTRRARRKDFVLLALATPRQSPPGPRPVVAGADGPA